MITSDWVKPQVYTGTTATGVDAFGIARDKDGTIYFALGNADFTNGHLVDSLGNSNYDIHSERGTIMTINPGSNTREISCTGTRFPVAMARSDENTSELKSLMRISLTVFCLKTKSRPKYITHN